MNPTTVTKGFATWLGTIGAAALIAIPMLGKLADAAAPLGVSPRVYVILSAVLTLAVIIGRMSQAIALGLAARTTVGQYGDGLPAIPEVALPPGGEEV